MGKIELDHTGSGGGVTLSSDGTDLLLDGTAVGGTPLELYAENPSGAGSPTATGTDAVAIGDSRGIASGARAISLGNSLSSAESSFASQIGSNSSVYGATNTHSVAMGASAKASSADCVAIGNSAKSENTAALALGKEVSATRAWSVAMGYRSSSALDGKLAYASGHFSSVGDAQTGTFVLRADTTDATPEALTTNATPASSKGQIFLPNNSAYFFSGTIVARQQAADGTDMGAWEIKGAIRREGSAGTTVLVNSVINEFEAPTGWSVDLSADTTNGGLKIEVTGAAATDIRWVATVHTSEVTYA